MELLWALENLNLRSLLDIFLVGLVFFGVSFFIRGTQAMALLRGMLLVFITLLLLSSLLNLLALRWLLEAETFERFLHRRFVGQKRFSVEGGESMLVALDTHQIAKEQVAVVVVQAHKMVDQVVV